MRTKAELEYIRAQTKSKFDQVRQTWIDCGRWALPHRTKWLQCHTEGARNNQLIVDHTHTIALRSYVAGFLEGNTSSSRPWVRVQHQNEAINQDARNKRWLQHYTKRIMALLSTGNFYNAAGQAYYDFGTFNTACYFIDELDNGVYFHVLVPGSYYVINNKLGIADTLVREFNLTVKALVDTYGQKNRNGTPIWSNFSPRVKKLYEDGTYTQKIDVVTVCERNSDFDPSQPVIGENRQWVTYTYELGGAQGQYYQDGQEFGLNPGPKDDKKYLNVSYSKRKRFIVARSESSNNFEYGEKGPTLDALGLIKSLNKKAIGKDVALEQMLKPALQGPASIKKSYLSSQSNTFIPLDATAQSQGGLKLVNPIQNSGIALLNVDVTDLRQMIDKLYYADYLLFLSRNPKTRTATETNAVMNEQQLIVGPNLQALNWTHNEPVIEFAMQYVLEEDPYLEEIPPDLAGEWLRLDFISVFAQAQKSADLPNIDRFISMISAVGQIDPSVFQKANLDKLCDVYEDRLYLPEGLNRSQVEVEALREAAERQQQRMQMLQETIPNMAGAAKDMSQAMQGQT